MRCTGKAKIDELTKKSKEELLSTLADLQKELSQLRVAKVTGGAPAKLSKLSVVRKSIAQVSTVLTLQQKAALRKYFAKKKYVPVDLREKKTRALRKALSKSDASRQTVSQRKAARHFPQLVYALAAQ